MARVFMMWFQTHQIVFVLMANHVKLETLSSMFSHLLYCYIFITVAISKLSSFLFSELHKFSLKNSYYLEPFGLQLGEQLSVAWVLFELLSVPWVLVWSNRSLLREARWSCTPSSQRVSRDFLFSQFLSSDSFLVGKKVTQSLWRRTFFLKNVFSTRNVFSQMCKLWLHASQQC